MVYVGYKYNDYLVSEKRLNEFQRIHGKFNDDSVKIVKEINCCKTKIIDKFFEANWTWGFKAFLVLAESGEIYICKEDGVIWDIVKGEEEQLREKVKKLSALHGYDSIRLEDFVIHRHNLKLNRLGSNRLNELVDFFSDYEANVKEEQRRRELYEMMSGID